MLEFMINYHERMGPGRDQTRDSWIYSQTRIGSQTRPTEVKVTAKDELKIGVEIRA